MSSEMDVESVLDERNPFTHILTPTDGSEPSINAGRLSIQIAAWHKAALTFVYVVNQATVEEIASASGQDIDVVYRDLSNKAYRYLDYMERLATAAGLTAHKVIRYGMPHREITDLARRERADLIVIGRAGGVGTGSLSMQRTARGSVVAGVIEYAACPVLVVRHSTRLGEI